MITILWWARGAAVASLLSTIMLFAQSMRESAAEEHWSATSLQAAHRFALSQRSLQRDMLNARVGILRDYDSINRDLGCSRHSLEQLAALSAGSNVRAQVRSALAGLSRQEILVEQFKTNNALLQNALSSFTTASGRGEPAGGDQGLAARVLKLTLDTSPEAIGDAREAIDAIPMSTRHAAATRHLIANASLVLAVLPAIDRDLRELRALRLDERSDRMRQLLVSESDARRERVAQWEIGLISLGVLTIALFTLWLLLLRLNNRHFRRLAENEHMNATVASLLIDGRLFDGDERMQHVLAQLADRIGADHAWLHIADRAGEPWSICWPSPSQGASELFLRLADIHRTSEDWKNDVIRLRAREGERRADSPAERGDFADLILFRSDRSAAALMGFASRGATMKSDPGIVMAMTAAFAAIRQALERHMLEGERLALERKLARSRRMEVMGAVSTGVAHNFNNILGAIGGFGEIALAHTKPGSVVRRSLNEIQFAVDRAEKIVEEILHFGKPQPGRKEAVDPIDLVSEAVQMFEASRRPGQLRIDMISAPERIRVNRAQIQQVLLNIFNNASIATAAGGDIRVEMRAEQLSAAVSLSHSALGPGQYAVFAVIDRGRGIAERNIPRLFEPFFTTRPDGTGLGLATAWDMVVDHGGTIDVASGLMLGSTFSIWLPVLRAAPSPAAASLTGEPEQAKPPASAGVAHGGCGT